MAKILIVEDNCSIARLLRFAFYRHEVRIAATVTAAQEQISDGWPELVTLDLRLGEESAESLTQIVKNRKGNMLFIILSAHGAREACGRMEADDWLEKPFDPDVLLSKVEALLARTNVLQASHVQS